MSKKTGKTTRKTKAEKTWSDIDRLKFILRGVKARVEPAYRSGQWVINILNIGYVTGQYNTLAGATRAAKEWNEFFKQLREGVVSKAGFQEALNKTFNKIRRAKRKTPRDHTLVLGAGGEEVRGPFKSPEEAWD